ncbi:MAG: polysaccharide deacetylase family protein, partial [Bacteroidetes bacterium]
QHEDIRTQALKELPNQERLEVLEAAGFHQEKEFEVPLALDRQQIEEMKPYVNFQAHTVFHPCLPKCTEAEARWALNKGKEILEHDFELSINALAYPNGDYSDRDIRLAQAAGYKLGLTVDFGYNTLHTDPFRLKRLSVDDYDDVDTLALKASGIWAFLKTRNGKKQAHGWTDQVVEDTDEAEYQSELKTYHNS